MKGGHHITRKLSYHNYCSVKHNTLINKQRSYCGNGAAYKYGRVTWGKAPPRGKAPPLSNYEFTHASGSIS